LTDFNTGGFTVKLDPKKVIRATYYTVHISNHTYEKVLLKDFLNELAGKLKLRDSSTLHIVPATLGCVHKRTAEFKVEPDKKLTTQRIFDRVSSFIPEGSIVIAETGQSLFSIAETLLPKGTTFFGQVFYGSIGYSVGATLGAAIAAKQKNRPVLLFVGDGSFQMTAQEVSTMIRYDTKPIIFLLNNDGYLIERVIDDGPYNDIQNWKYHKLPPVFGDNTVTFEANFENQFESALKEASQLNKHLVFIEMKTDKWDASEPMRKAGASMAKANHIKPRSTTQTH